MYPLTSIAWPYSGLRYWQTEFEFEWSQAQVQFFSKCKSCSWDAFLKCEKRENSAGFYMQGRQSLLTFLTIVTHWSRFTTNFYYLVIAEAVRVLCHLVMFLTVFFYWMYKMKYSQYQDSSVIHGWFVSCAFGWEMHRLSKSLEIRFRTASFLKLSLLSWPCLRPRRVEKCQAIVASLDGLQEQHLMVSLSILLSLMFFFPVSLSQA